MKPNIIAHNAHGTRIPGPDCKRFPGCLTRIHTYLDFGKSGHAETSENFSARFTGPQIREAIKQLILALRAHRPQHNKLLDRDVELWRRSTPPDVREGEETTGRPGVVFIPWSSNTSGEGGAPPGMKALYEIRMPRKMDTMDPEELKYFQEQLELSWTVRDEMTLLLRFLWYCRNWAEVVIVCRPHS